MEDYEITVLCANPQIALACYENGVSTGSPGSAIVFFPNSYTGDGTVSGNRPVPLATIGQVGTVHGLAWRHSANQLFAASMTKRHSGLGPQGIGGVYIINATNPYAPVVTNFTLQGVAPANGGANIDLGTLDSSSGPNYTLGGALAANIDLDAFA